MVTIAVFTDMLIYGLVVPILPGHAAALGVSEWAVGVLFGSYAAALLLATPVLGALSDRVGRRRPMLLGLLGLGAATLLFAYAPGYAGLLAARVVQGVAAAATWTAGLALVADLYPAERRGRAMGVVMSGMTAGTLLGPPAGGLLYEWGGYRTPFLVAATVAALDGLARWWLLDEPPRVAGARLAPVTLLRDRTVLVTAGAVVVGAGAWGLLEPVLPLYLERRFGASPGTVGLLFGAATLVYGIASPPVGALADRWGTRPTMAAGIVVLAASLPLVGVAASLVWMTATLVVLSVAYALVINPTLPALAAAVDRRGGGAYASAYAIFNAAYAGGMMIGPVVGGGLTSLVGLPPALVITGAGVLAYLLALHAGRP